jgi:hypothetical protein
MPWGNSNRAGTERPRVHPARLFPTHIFGGGVDNTQGRQYDVAPDGCFLINTVLDTALAPITLLTNWKPPGDEVASRDR